MISTQTTIKYVIFALRLPLKRDKNHMVSQMARTKYLGEPFMVHLENLYNIPCILYVLLSGFILLWAHKKLSLFMTILAIKIMAFYD